MRFVLGTVIIFLMLSVAQAASFNCAKANTNIEKLICGDPALSKLDDDLNKSYLQFLEYSADKPAGIQEQRKWLKNLRSDCQDETCLKAAYRNRIGELTIEPPQSASNQSSELETTVQKLKLVNSTDQQVCLETAAMLNKDKACRPYDAFCRPYSKNVPPNALAVYSVTINGNPALAFNEIATNEYGYTRIFQSTAGDIDGYKILYLEKFGGDNFPRVVETWKVSSKALNEVFGLSPGPTPAARGGKGERKEKSKLPKDTRASEFAEVLRQGEKLSDEWSPIVKIQNSYYLIERECDGEWVYGGYYACDRITNLRLKKVANGKDAAASCQFARIP